MKKILTLFAVGLMALTAMAGTAANRFSKVELRPGAIQRAEMNLDAMIMNIENGVEMPGMIQKSCEIDGKTWKCFILFEGDMSDMVASDWVFAKQLYNASIIFMTDYKTDSPAADKYYYSYACCWPTMSIINCLNAPEEDWDNLSWPIDNRRLTFEELLKYQNEMGLEASFERGKDSNILQPWSYEGNAITGWFCFAAGGLHKGKQMTDMSAGSKVTLKAYTAPTAEASNGTINMNFKGSCLEGTTTIGTFNSNFNGPIDRIDGYEPKNNTFTIGEVHIINTGQRENDNWDYYDETWGPLTRYYLNLCSDAMTYDISQYENQNVPTYYPITIDRISVDLNKALNQPQGKNDGMYAFIQGAFYAAADKGDDFYSQYDMVPNAFEDDDMGTYILTKPAPHAMIPGTANLYEFAIFDGCAGAYGGWYTIWKNVQLNIGSKKGLELKMNDSYMNKYDLTYSGNIIYHNDPEDYTKYVIVPSTTENGVKSLLNEGMVVTGSNGVINVVIEGANVEVYNVAGMKVAEKFVSKQDTFNVGNGLYIVKVGNKTTKVAL